MYCNKTLSSVFGNETTSKDRQTNVLKIISCGALKALYTIFKKINCDTVE